MAGRVFVIGAGLAGLSAAVALARGGARVTVIDSAPQAGGRCRSYLDRTLGLAIDNGNHLVLSGNRETMAYLDAIGTRDRLEGPANADFTFTDAETGERWTVRINDGKLGWWVFAPSRRVPGTRARDYLSLAKLLLAGRDTTIGEAIATKGTVYDRLLRPIMVSALNSEPQTATARLAATIIRESLLRGGTACRPLIATSGLSDVFIDPAIRLIESRGGTVTTGRRLFSIGLSQTHATSLTFGDGVIDLAPDDAVVLAVPARVAESLLPDLRVPLSFNAIVNGHFVMPPPAGTPAMLGVLNATVEWIFAFHDRISVTVSDANRLVDVPREELANRLWADVRRALGIETPLPPWQIVIEKRATFAATPENERRRPATATAWRNLVLAGDWTATGLPATIEGAIRSGGEAARVLLARPALRAPRPAMSEHVQ